MKYSEALENAEFLELKEKRVASLAAFETLCAKRNAINLRIDQAEKYMDECFEAVHAWLDSH